MVIIIIITIEGSQRNVFVEFKNPHYLGTKDVRLRLKNN